MSERNGALPGIIATATALPEHRIGPEETKAWIRRLFGSTYRDTRRVEQMVDHTDIESRYLVRPPEHLVSRRSLEESNDEYIREAIELATRAVEDCLSEAQIDPKQVDLIIPVSCTGYMIPSLDAYLINHFRMRSNVKRLPITELGCAGGAAGMERAYEYVSAFPDSTVLLVATEVTSITFQPADLSWANLVAAMLFGDGSAAALVTGRRDRPGPVVLDTESHFFQDTLHYMAFPLKNSGFHLVMSREVPDVVRTSYRPVLEQFLARHSLTVDDLAFFVLHPGGDRILRNFEEYVGVPADGLAPARDVMRRVGNLSSATVLFVLDELLHHRPASAGQYGLMSSLGPGFCTEMLLLRWDD
ncbi:MAG: type III polyketide synthase [Chloroflexota bacterium]